MFIKGKHTPTDSIIRLIESVFYREKELRKAVHDARLDADTGHSRLGRHGGKGFISDPTAIQAMRNMKEIPEVTLSDGFTVSYPERWLKVVDGTYSTLDDISKTLLQSRYTSHRTHLQCCADLHISHSTFYKLINEARSFARAAACQLGLIKVM